MADLVRHAVGVDLVEVALRFALGEPVPDELCAPRFRQPVAIRFFTAQPGPLPTGRVRSAAGLERAKEFTWQETARITADVYRRLLAA